MDSTRVSSARQLAQVAASNWELIQVELQGKYSLQRMRTFYAYSIQTRWHSILLWCIVTPIPSLIVNILLDVPPLARPSDGRDANSVFWARLAVFTVIMGYWSLIQTGYLTPALGLTRWHALSTSVVVSTACTVNAYILAGVIAMPVPFLLLAGSPVYSLSIAVMFGFYFGHRLHNDADLRASSNRGLAITWVQLCLMFIFPAFIYGFNSISSKHQMPYMVIIPVVKTIAKNIMSRLVGSNNDLKPVELIFDIDCFSSIYISLAMQRATTISTSLTVMLIDFAQGCVSVYDVYHGFQPLKRFMNNLPANHPLYGKNFLEIAIALDQESNVISGGENQTPNEALSGSMFQNKSKVPRASGKICVAPSQTNQNTVRKNMSLQHEFDSPERKSAFLLATRKLLFTTEFVLLVEYTEVIMPVFYSLLMAATYYLPNRAFYPTIADIDEHKLWTMVTNVLMYAFLELASLVVMDLVLHRITGVSAMRQVGFVLDRQRLIVQSKLLSWVLYAMENSLEHFGADFSFQFKWLHSN